MENQKLNIFLVDDLIEKAIIYFTRNKEVPILSLQKGIFLFLYSYAVENGYDYTQLLKIAGFEPYKFGPFSEDINGQCDTLTGYRKLSVKEDKSRNKDSKKFKGNEKSLMNYKYNDNEIKILNNIDNLVKNLSPLELTFYVYFHPLINSKLREYYTSQSEIKSRLKKEEQKYLKELKNKGIIDQETEDMIIYGDNEN